MATSRPGLTPMQWNASKVITRGSSKLQNAQALREGRLHAAIRRLQYAKGKL
jgi:hypothetical protein